MNRFFAAIIRLLNDALFNNRRRRAYLTALACVVVFCTTYMLILPAFTITADKSDAIGLHLDSGNSAKIFSGQNESGKAVDDSTSDSISPEDAESADNSDIVAGGTDAAHDTSGGSDASEHSDAIDSGAAGHSSANGTDASDEVNVDTDGKSAEDAGKADIAQEGKKSEPDDSSNDDSVSVDADAGNPDDIENDTEIREGDSLEKTVLASDGKNYSIKVSYGKDAGIPDGAELDVSEIMPGDRVVTEHAKNAPKRAKTTRVIRSAGNNTEDRSADTPGSDNDNKDGGNYKKDSMTYEDYVKSTEEALDMEEGSAGYIRLFDIKIVDKNDPDVKYQPEDGAVVEVRIELADAEDRRDLSVVHFADGSEEGDKLESSTENAKDGSAVEFETDGFSVYAVVDEGDTSDNARMTVEFYNGDNLIASMIVKNADTLDDLETILYDPGVGSIPEGVLFDGWTFEKNYTLDDANNAMSIGEVREWAEAKSITEHETVKLYAALVKTFTVTYLDERNASLGTDNVTMIAEDTSVNYTVNMGYTPIDDLHNFAGWNVNSGSSHIEGYTDGTTYENGTEITITGDVVLSVNAPAGHWLIFNENGKGATYNAPVFVESGKGTVQPDNTKAGHMTRSGYTFAGWYTDAACTDGNEYVFGNEISDNTTIYAKWIVNPNADYTVIVWKQSVTDDYDADDADKTYDFAFSTTLNTASGTDINSIDLSAYQNKDGQTITVDGENHSFYGFRYNTTKGVVANEDENGDPVTTVLPNGTTVVNLYYDREVVTYDFCTVITSMQKVNNPQPGKRYYFYRDGITYYFDVTNNTNIVNG